MRRFSALFPDRKSPECRILAEYERRYYKSARWNRIPQDRRICQRDDLDPGSGRLLHLFQRDGRKDHRPRFYGPEGKIMPAAPRRGRHPGGDGGHRPHTAGRQLHPRIAHPQVRLVHPYHIGQHGSPVSGRQNRRNRLFRPGYHETERNRTNPCRKRKQIRHPVPEKLAPHTDNRYPEILLFRRQRGVRQGVRVYERRPHRKKRGRHRTDRSGGRNGITEAHQGTGILLRPRGYRHDENGQETDRARLGPDNHGST